MTNLMAQINTLVPPLLVGLVLGCWFFYLLWLTVQKGLQSPYPALWFFSGLLLRMFSTIAGFYWIANNDMWRLLACLIGFVLGRLLITKLLSIQGKYSIAELQKNATEHNNAP
jgi:F1F0 ATPase subunit 2